MGLSHEKKIWPWPTMDPLQLPHCLYVDEVGVGCLAGPMYIGVVYLGDIKNWPLPPLFGLHDSKILHEHERDLQYTLLTNLPGLVYFIQSVPAERIDEVGMGAAWREGVQQGVLHLSKLLQQREVPIHAHQVVLDGNKPVVIPGFRVQPVVAADRRHIGVSMAAILAKCERDAFMVQQADLYPEFREIFQRGKGYAFNTQHKELLQQCIYTPLHRKSFNPLHAALHPASTIPHTHQVDLLPCALTLTTPSE